jgi:peptidoglycan hydrolase-like protein with peptidoglycan-binding domain
MRARRESAAYIFPLAPTNGKENSMKLRKLVIATLTLSSAGAIAAANETSANTQPSSSQSYSSTSQASSQGDSQVSQIQQALNDAGLNAGPVDGKMGPKTKSALKQFQQQKGLQASGSLDQQTLAALNTGSSGSSSSQQGFFSPQGQDANGGSLTGNSTSGTNGSTASSGTNGSTASSATNGSTASSGTNGASGTNGSTASSGTNGSSSSSGTNGSSSSSQPGSTSSSPSR